jgi:predicted ATPase/DNA-binding XRE family transcriptional regulator
MGTVSATPFAALLKRYRLAAGFTQEELAERADMSPHTVSDLERGLTRMPHPQTVELLARALDLSPGDREQFLAAASHRRGPSAAAETVVDAASAALPADLTPLIGRERDEAGAVRLLSGANVRLLTLTGPGGMGKTRLAQRVASTLRSEFLDDVAFVELAGVLNPNLVAQAVARALGIHESGGRSIRDQLRAYLENRNMLLLLDNFEHLLPAGLFVVELLQSCPELKALVTSRAPLHVRGEQELQVPPLALPAEPRAEGDDPLRYAAVALFVDRARAVQAEFEPDRSQALLLVEMCRRLDGLPLAIELAAARVKVMPLATLAGRLCAPTDESNSRLGILTSGPMDMPERQRTMRNAVAWSYDLLSRSEQALFRRLAVSAGGWTLQAAEAVCGFENKGMVAIADGLTALVDNSLLVSRLGGAADPRFELLETVREYGLELLTALSELEPARARHARYHLELAEKAEPELTGSDQAVWLEKLECEFDNLEAALSWSWETGDREIAVRMATALWRFWFIRGHLSEGQRWFERLLDPTHGPTGGALEISIAPELRTRFFFAAGAMAYGQTDLAQAAASWGRCLEVKRELGDMWGVADALNVLGITAHDRSDHDLAESLLRESLELNRELGSGQGIAHCLNNLASISEYRGNLASALIMLEESVRLNHDTGNHRGEATCLKNMADIATMRAEYELAEEHALRSLRIWQQLEDKRGVGLVMETLANAKMDQGEDDQAAEYQRQARDLYREVGFRGGLASVLQNMSQLSIEQGYLDTATKLVGHLSRSWPFGLGGNVAPVAAARVAFQRPLHASRATESLYSRQLAH